MSTRLSIKPIRPLTIGFVYNPGRLTRLKSCMDGTAPTEFLYGAVELMKQGHDVRLFETDLSTPIHWPSAALNLIGENGPVKLDGLLMQATRNLLPQLNQCDVVVGTTTGHAFALALWRKAGKLKRPVVGIQCGLFNHRINWFRRSSTSCLLREMETVLFGDAELAPLQETFPGARGRATVNQFGIDTAFWTPGPARETGYVLSVGNDGRRDYETLIQAARDLPWPVVLLTSSEIPALHPNVRHITSSYKDGITDDQLRELYRGARCVVVPLHPTCQPSGQSVALQAMACEKPVILTRTEGIWSHTTVRDGKTLYLVPPHNAAALADQIRRVGTMAAGPLGVTARTAVQEHARIDYFAAGILSACHRAISSSPRRVFYFFLDSEIRRSVVSGALACPGANYMLYGADLLPGHGFEITHNLEKADSASPWAARFAWLAHHFISSLGGSSGDFQAVVREWRRRKQSDVILSTVDNVGVPLVWMNALGLLRRPLLYISIGLPERIASIKIPLIRALYRTLYRRVPRFVTYGWEEAIRLREWLGLPADSNRVVFIPFGVDPAAFRPMPEIAETADVLAVGADMQRDFHLLLSTASQMPELSFRIITSPRHAGTFGTVPPNVTVLTNVPFPEIGRYLAAARIITLPCKDNTYSSGTTTLLQALSMAKAVVVTRTGAIRDGYQLENNVNCRLVAPGAGGELGSAIRELVADPATRVRLGNAARRTIETHLSWDHYVQRLADVITAMDGRLTISGQNSQNEQK